MSKNSFKSNSNTSRGFFLENQETRPHIKQYIKSNAAHKRSGHTCIKLQNTDYHQSVASRMPSEKERTPNTRDARSKRQGQVAGEQWSVPEG